MGAAGLRALRARGHDRGLILDPLRAATNAILVAFVLVVMYTDWRYRRIPNVVTYPAMLAGLILAGMEAFPGAIAGRGLLDHAAGIVVAFLVVWPLNRMGGIKAGDGKLLMAVGALRGVEFFFYSFFYGAILGGVLALVLIGLARLDPPDAPQQGRFWTMMKSQVPYGIALGGGALVALAREVLGA